MFKVPLKTIASMPSTCDSFNIARPSRPREKGSGTIHGQCTAAECTGTFAGKTDDDTMDAQGRSSSQVAEIIMKRYDRRKEHAASAASLLLALTSRLPGRADSRAPLTGDHRQQLNDSGWVHVMGVWGTTTRWGSPTATCSRTTCRARRRGEEGVSARSSILGRTLAAGMVWSPRARARVGGHAGGIRTARRRPDRRHRPQGHQHHRRLVLPTALQPHRAGGRFVEGRWSAPLGGCRPPLLLVTPASSTTASFARQARMSTMRWVNVLARLRPRSRASTSRRARLVHDLVGGDEGQAGGGALPRLWPCATRLTFDGVSPLGAQLDFVLESFAPVHIIAGIFTRRKGGAADSVLAGRRCSSVRGQPIPRGRGADRPTFGTGRLPRPWGEYIDEFTGRWAKTLAEHSRCS